MWSKAVGESEIEAPKADRGLGKFFIIRFEMAHFETHFKGILEYLF